LGAYYGSVTLPRTGLLEAFDAWVGRERDRLLKLDLSDENWFEIQEVEDLGHGMLEHYLQWAPQKDSLNELQVTMPEVPIAMPIPGLRKVIFAGTADGHAKACERPRGESRYWLLEWKSCASFPDFQALLLDEQALGYVWACRRDPRFAGIEPVGVIFTFLRKKLPARPQLLQSGALSKRKNIDTTYDTYLQCIRERELDEGDYSDILAKLKERPNNFFKRVFIPVQPGALKVFEHDLVGVAKEMLDPNLSLYPSCLWFRYARCPFRVPCTLRRHGVNPYALLRANYITRNLSPTTELEED